MTDIHLIVKSYIGWSRFHPHFFYTIYFCIHVFKFNDTPDLYNIF